LPPGYRAIATYLSENCADNEIEIFRGLAEIISVGT
jgi:hypothetical protein